MPPLIRLLRPHQWLKNGFVFMGLLFDHAWTDPIKLYGAIWVFIAFCLISSTVYVANDIVDRERDKHHPRKRNRPIATGQVSVRLALVMAIICLSAGLSLGFFLGGHAIWVLCGYLVLNVSYSLGLKHIVVLDVFLIASGFMLRILAGTVGLGIAPSQWLLLCGLLLTLFLGFAKRQSELDALGEEGENHRRVLAHYSHSLLAQFTSISAAGVIVSYSLYTVSPETIMLHGTSHLIYTVPFVLYGIFRYLHRLHCQGGGGDPASDLLRDPHLASAAVGWLVTTLWLLGAF